MNHKKIFVALGGFAPFVFSLLVTGLGCNSGGRADQFLHAHNVTKPRMQSLSPDETNRKLLKRYMPEFYIAPGGYRPVSFYEYYLPNTVVRDGANGERVVQESPNRKSLKQIIQNKDYYLDYSGNPASARNASPVHRPTVYGRVYRDRLKTKDGSFDFLFLKYSLVFSFSGLPARMGTIPRLFAGMIGDTDAWHELDIHGAIYVVLSARSLRAVAVIVAQHHYHRVFLVGSDIVWPADNNIQVSFAQHSNEPYLIDPLASSRYERVVGDNTDLAYLFGRSDTKPIGAAEDLVVTPADGAARILPNLRMLDADDPLYTARIPLGNRVRLFGVLPFVFRSGPHGMDCYSPSELVNLADLMAFWHMDPEDDRLFELLGRHIRSRSDYDLIPILNYQRERLMANFARGGLR